MIAAANPSEWDILAIQEPWIDHLGKTRANSKWNVVYPTLKGLDDLPLDLLSSSTRNSHQNQSLKYLSNPTISRLSEYAPNITP